MSDGTIFAGGVTINYWRTNDPIIPSGGYGGWQIVQRPLKPSLTNWTGRDPFGLSMPIMLYNGGDSVEPERRALEQLATGTPPEIVDLQGQALPVPAQASGKWVINDLVWGEEVRRKSDFSLTRKLVTVTLLEHITDTILRTSSASTRVNGHQVIRHYRVKAGDTLQKIAGRELGDAKRWTDLATLNGLRSSGQLKTGMLLRLP